MKKDNFDLRSYLIENKMTENSRGDVRHQLGKTILDTRILAEMQIPADPDQLEEGDPYDHHDPDYDEDWAAHQGADMADAYNDAQMDAGVDEGLFNRKKESDYMDPIEGCFHMVNNYITGGQPTVTAHSDNIPKVTELRSFLEENPRLASYCAHYDDPEPLQAFWDDKLGEYFEEHPEMKKLVDGWTGNLFECGDLGGDIPLDEAGYTDDDDEYVPDDLDLDDRGGVSLLDLVKGDRKAGKARKAAAVDTAADSAMDDEPVDTDTPDIDDPDAENAAGTSDPNAEAQPGLSAQVKYNPNTVEMMMDDQELDQYLSGFRRPQVAVNVLNRAIRTAQDEVNDSIGLNHLYIVLENGFYVTSRTERGQVIAKVTADQEWRKKNFGED